MATPLGKLSRWVRMPRILISRIDRYLTFYPIHSILSCHIPLNLTAPNLHLCLPIQPSYFLSRLTPLNSNFPSLPFHIVLSVPLCPITQNLQATIIALPSSPHIPLLLNFSLQLVQCHPPYLIRSLPYQCFWQGCPLRHSLPLGAVRSCQCPEILCNASSGQPTPANTNHDYSKNTILLYISAVQLQELKWMLDPRLSRCNENMYYAPNNK